MCFGTGWEKFAKDAKLCEGNTCVVEPTVHDKLYRVAVFEPNDRLMYNAAGNSVMVNISLIIILFFILYIAHSTIYDT